MLDLKVIINTSVFIIPLGNNLFKIGATYNWHDKTDLPTDQGKQELLVRIREILNCDFEIISHAAGIRPTVRDRKPLLGKHPKYSNMYVMNGLGTRGVMLGPWAAKILFEHIENDMEIEQSINTARFKKFCH
jgi:glycine/D-amino acid oxidase-like deaminating enzyme